MSVQFVMCARAVRGGEFTARPGGTRFLLVPDGELPSPRHEATPAVWFKRLREAAVWVRTQGVAGTGAIS